MEKEAERKEASKSKESEESNESKEASESKESKENEDSKEEPKKKRAPIPPLNENLLLSDRGLIKLQQLFSSFQFREGKELAMLDQTLQMYQDWASELYPRIDFITFLSRIEKLGKKKKGPLKTYLSALAVTNVSYQNGEEEWSPNQERKDIEDEQEPSIANYFHENQESEEEWEDNQHREINHVDQVETTQNISTSPYIEDNPKIAEKISTTKSLERNSSHLSQWDDDFDLDLELDIEMELAAELFS